MLYSDCNSAASAIDRSGFQACLETYGISPTDRVDSLAAYPAARQLRRWVLPTASPEVVMRFIKKGPHIATTDNVWPASPTASQRWMDRASAWDNTLQICNVSRSRQQQTALALLYQTVSIRPVRDAFNRDAVPKHLKLNSFTQRAIP
jgi:hypothetical protein